MLYVNGMPERHARGRQVLRLIQHEEGLSVTGDLDGERETAIYSRAEVHALMFDERVPVDRRLFYAISYLAGRRLGETSGLRVRHLDLDEEPLGAVVFARSYARDRTKTNTTIRMPVHPVLGQMLRAWLDRGFEQMFGREPEPDDFVVPRPPQCRSKFGPSRDKNYVRKQLLRDLETLELRARRTHDLRRSFISHAQQDGAQPHVLIRLTHPSAKKATAFAGYTEFSWADFCTEVAKLKVDVPRLRVLQPVQAPAAFAVAGGRAPTYIDTKTPKWRPSRPDFATLKDKTPGKSGGFGVEAPGVEVCDGAAGEGGSGRLRLVSGMISRGDLRRRCRLAWVLQHHESEVSARTARYKTLQFLAGSARHRRIRLMAMMSLFKTFATTLALLMSGTGADGASSDSAVPQASAALALDQDGNVPYWPDGLASNPHFISVFGTPVNAKSTFFKVVYPNEMPPLCAGLGNPAHIEQRFYIDFVPPGSYIDMNSSERSSNEEFLSILVEDDYNDQRGCSTPYKKRFEQCNVHQDCNVTTTTTFGDVLRCNFICQKHMDGTGTPGLL